ncbi:mercuric reductase [Haliangium sp.]|uniref:mercuric reductase n=1 Tax=Haliangium sp. TaxID=2663208 RepID=UPI003D0C462F
MNPDAAPLARIAIAPDDEFNRRLVASVHPAGWVNPEPARRYDLVVVGAGTAGLVTAAGAAGLGARVALVEKHLMGGDCLNAGCVPSKALIRSARVAAQARRGRELGVHTGEVDVDFAAVMTRMRRLRAEIAPVDGADRFRSLGVHVFLGPGRFTGPCELEVAGARLRFRRAVIATGARAAVPPIEGLTEAGYLTNDTVFELTELPARLVVIGAGPIGCELAQSFASFGARVTLIEALPDLLAKEEPEAAAVVAARLARDGVAVHTDAEVTRVRRDGADRVVTLRHGQDSEEIRADAILVATGRRPNLDGLDLDRAGVARGPTGLTLDPRLRTTNRRIYAAGDVTGDHQFTHAADAMARLVLRNALFFGRQRADDVVIPRVTFTTPEVAAVGLTPAQADARGIPLTTFEVALSDVDRAVVDGDTDGFARVHVRRGGDRILGATLVAPHAGEAIAELALAMQSGLGLSAVGATVHAYPTTALALRQVADQHARTRLTPAVARLLRWILALRR